MIDGYNFPTNPDVVPPRISDDDNLDAFPPSVYNEDTPFVLSPNTFRLLQDYLGTEGKCREEAEDVSWLTTVDGLLLIPYRIQALYNGCIDPSLLSFEYPDPLENVRHRRTTRRHSTDP